MADKVQSTAITKQDIEAMLDSKLAQTVGAIDARLTAALASTTRSKRDGLLTDDKVKSEDVTALLTSYGPIVAKQVGEDKDASAITMLAILTAHQQVYATTADALKAITESRAGNVDKVKAQLFAAQEGAKATRESIAGNALRKTALLEQLADADDKLTLELRESLALLKAEMVTIPADGDTPAKLGLPDFLASQEATIAKIEAGLGKIDDDTRVSKDAHKLDLQRGEQSRYQYCRYQVNLATKAADTVRAQVAGAWSSLVLDADKVEANRVAANAEVIAFNAAKSIS